MNIKKRYFILGGYNNEALHKKLSLLLVKTIVANMQTHGQDQHQTYTIDIGLLIFYVIGAGATLTFND